MSSCAGQGIPPAIGVFDTAFEARFDKVRSTLVSGLHHGTSSLSVTHEYLGLERGRPMFRQGFTCPALLEDPHAFYPYGAITRYGCPFQNIPVFT